MISVYTPPTAPIKLIMAFPLLLNLFGVRSGISATAGERYSPMDTSRANREMMNKTIFTLLSATGSKSRKITASTVPVTINGILFPNPVSVLSDIAPKIGSRKMASTLSAAIMAPVSVSPIPNVFCRISGIMLSYICQNAQMERKARPINTVLL